MAIKGYLSEQTKTILRLHREGFTVKEIVGRAGCKRAAVYSALDRHELEAHGKIRYHWPEIQAYYNAGNSFRACLRHFGMSSLTLTKAVRRGDVKMRTQIEGVRLGYKLGTTRKPHFDVAWRKRQSDRAKANGLGGQTNYYHYQYKGIHMDSQWEVDLAIWLDERHISWERSRHLVFSWNDKRGEGHRYYPDFYLPTLGVYLDPKNEYLIEKDRFKIESVIQIHGIKLLWGLKEDVIAALEKLI